MFALLFSQSCYEGHGVGVGTGAFMALVSKWQHQGKASGWEQRDESMLWEPGVQF